MKRSLSLVLLLCSSTAFSQRWVRSEAKDNFSDFPYTVFTLTGEYLDAPSGANPSPPVIVLRCKDKPHPVGYHVYRNGELLSAYVSTGTIVNQNLRGVPAMYRLDDGKAQIESWGISTDGTSVFFPETTSLNLIYGHIMPHKENTGAPVKKLVLAVDEAYGSKVTARFDMPDPGEMAETCGLVVHKR